RFYFYLHIFPVILPFSLHCSRAHRDLHSFPTRRSSDLGPGCFASAHPGRFAYGRDPRTGRPSGHPPAGAGVCSFPEGLCQREKADRKSTRLNSSHLVISYAVFCLKKKKKNKNKKIIQKKKQIINKHNNIKISAKNLNVKH